MAWSSTDGRGEPAFGRDLLLSTLTPPPVPTAVSVFGGERVPFPKPPRELAERYFTVTAWAEHERGGHFPAVAEPQLLAETLRSVFRPLRGSG